MREVSFTMNWEKYRPVLGEKSVFTYKERYNTCHPYFGTKNIFYTLRNKIKGFDTLAEYLNETAKIEFTYVQNRPVVSFLPNVSPKLKSSKYKEQRKWAYNYVKRIVKLLELEPDDNLATGGSYYIAFVPLDVKDNLKRMRHLASYFAFENLHMLTQEKVRELKKHLK